MLNEPASTASDRQPPPAAAATTPPSVDSRLGAVYAAVTQVFDVSAEQLPDMLPPDEVNGGASLLIQPPPPLLIRFDGRLLLDAETAYARLDADLAPLGLTPVFTEAADVQRISVFDGRAAPAPRTWYLNLVLLVLTVLSLLYVGADFGIGELQYTTPTLGAAARAAYESNPFGELWRGIPYAASILLILGAHELGHYFAARRQNMAVTLPYFLPFPFGLFGTFGAFIQLRQPIRNRKILFEIGAAGPLAGLIFAIPILAYGLVTSPLAPIGPGLIEGDSLLYALAKRFAFGMWVPNAEFDVLLNQVAWAGWTGLFITGINLLPIGQLDGGHVLYALIGERAKRLYWPLMIALLLLSILTGGSLLFMLILLMFFGRVHAVPLDNITRLDPIRRGLALFTLLVFALVFVPVPLSVRIMPLMYSVLSLVTVRLFWTCLRRYAAP